MNVAHVRVALTRGRADRKNGSEPRRILRRKLDAGCAREPEVRANGLVHRIDEPLGAARREPVR